MFKILVLSRFIPRDIWEQCIARFKQRHLQPPTVTIPRWQFYFRDDQPESELDRIVQEAECIIGGRLDCHVAEQCHRLILFQVPFAGVDHLDFSCLPAKAPFYICNTHANSLDVAEFALGLGLALIMGIPRSDRLMRISHWSGQRSDERHMRIKDLRAGVVGLGHVGTEVVKLCECVGMKVSGIKLHVNAEDRRQFSSLDLLGEPDQLPDLFRRSDIVFVTIPLTSKTVGLIDKSLLALLEGGYLVNISRGRVVVEKDLYQALDNNVLGGAAIDAWYHYPKMKSSEGHPSDYPFHEMDNVVMSPHTAGFTKPFLEETVEQVLWNIMRVSCGLPPRFLVDPEAGY